MQLKGNERSVCCCTHDGPVEARDGPMRRPTASQFHGDPRQGAGYDRCQITFSILSNGYEGATHPLQNVVKIVQNYKWPQLLS